jgi:metal-responsive CopG/Arc/MetJ family transcriptional regulator
MRTTITLPDDLHEQVSSIARDRGTTVSRTIADLLRSSLQPADVRDTGRLARSSVTGLLTIRLDRPVTSEDVRALEDDA